MNAQTVNALVGGGFIESAGHLADAAVALEDDAAGQRVGQRHVVGDLVVEHDLAHVHFDDAIDQRRDLVETVAGDDHRRILKPLGEQVEENLARFRV